MVFLGRTKTVITPLVHEVQTHVAYRKILRFHVILVMQCITMCYKNHNIDMTLKTTFQNLHIYYILKYQLHP